MAHTYVLRSLRYDDDDDDDDDILRTYRSDFLRTYFQCLAVCGGVVRGARVDLTQACFLVCACECPRARACWCCRASLFHFCEMIVLFSCANISAVGISCACAIFFFCSFLKFLSFSFVLSSMCEFGIYVGKKIKRKETKKGK